VGSGHHSSADVQLFLGVLYLSVHRSGHGMGVEFRARQRAICDEVQNLSRVEPLDAKVLNHPVIAMADRKDKLTKISSYVVATGSILALYSPARTAAYLKWVRCNGLRCTKGVYLLRRSVEMSSSGFCGLDAARAALYRRRRAADVSLVIE
jgi:hypothetical protein